MRLSLSCFLLTLSSFFECVLGSKANFLGQFKDSIWDLIRSELLNPNEKENEVAVNESMDEDINSMATFLTEMSDKTTTSTATSPPGRPRKKFVDGMSDDTLSRRFAPLDDALRDETGVILTPVIHSNHCNNIEKDPHLVAAWHEARLTDELKSLIGIARNLIKALDMLPATSTVRTVLIKYMSLGINSHLFIICCYILCTQLLRAV